jgi:DNA-binding MarR family transcriptional regulator
MPIAAPDRFEETPVETAERIAVAVAGVHFALVALMERIHGQEASSGRRAILLNLRNLGPITVPRLAAMRPVSRQYVQRLVDQLERDGLVEKQANAAHRRSPTIALTALGAEHLADMLARERPIVECLATALPPDEAAALIASLGRVREHVGRIVDSDSGAAESRQ